MYGTLAEWRAYALARGDEAPTDADTAEANAALLRSSDYIKYSYVARFVAPHSETSLGVDEATYIAAGLELATPNFFSKTFTPAQQKILTEVKGIKWTVAKIDSDDRAASLVSPKSTLIDAILGGYLPLETGFAPFLGVIGNRNE